MRLIILFGLISLLGDIIYESARGVNGPYLRALGAGATVVGLVAGAAELLGCGTRLASGLLSDRTRAYWALAIGGYAMLATVPLLALTGMWELAALLIVLERVGKGVRSPARDTLLSGAAARVGTGWGFGIHEFLDQIGAVAGPLLLALLFAGMGATGAIGDYHAGYALLALPFAPMMVALLWAFRASREAPALDSPLPAFRARELPRAFWLYLAFTLLTTLGLVNFMLIGYHLRARLVLGDARIPLLYASAMLVDALTALAIGRIYDRLKGGGGGRLGGLRLLASLPLLTAFIPALAFADDVLLVVAGGAIWGAVMGAHETLMRAVVADMVAPQERGTGYGVFHAGYGAAMFAGAAIAGALYERTPALLPLFVAAVEVASVVPLAMMLRSTSKKSS
ncbi:MAG: MFS transporter [Thermoplasmatota archaeon]